MSPYEVSYNLGEVFEIAEQIERNGAAFYKKAAGFSRSAEMRDLLLSLAEQEDEHERTFAAMRKKLVPAGSDIASYDKDQTVALYLQALASQYVFDMKQTAANPLTGRETTADILRLAICQEKSSIVLYLGISDAMGSAEDRGKVDHITSEERKHLTDLVLELQKIAS